MKLRALVAAGAAIGALAAPAVAEAHRDADHGDVRVHVRSADRALDRVVRLVASGDAADAAAQLREHRRQLRAAIKDARGALRGADGAREIRRVALAYRSLAGRQTADIARYADLLGGGALGAVLQEQVARVVAAALSEREDVLDQLTALVEELPKGSRAAAAAWLRRLTTDGQAHVGALLGLLSRVEFPPDVQGLMARSLELAFDAIDTAMARLDGLVALLPSQAREPVRRAIEQVEATTVMVRGMLEALVGSLPAAGAGDTPQLPDFASLLPGLEQVLPGLGGTLPSHEQLRGNLANVLPALQHLLPDLGAGLGVGDGTLDLEGILEQVEGLVPGLDELLGGLVGQVGGTPSQPGGGDPVGGVEDLLGGLVGGLLGGLR